MKNRARKIVIVGAGPGGLASAMLLSKAGFDVTVLERQPFAGGRTSAIESEGFRFDRGPTFFLYPQILSEIFAACGRNLFDLAPMVRLDPQYRLKFGSGGQLDATPDIEQMTREVARLAPQDAPSVARFLNDNRERFEKMRPVLQSAFNGWGDLFSAKLLKLLPNMNPFRSLDSELGRYFSDPRMRLAFSFQSKYLGMSPFRCPSLFSILSFLEYEYGVFHPLGGCAAVSEVMARQAEEQGVTLRLNEPVTSLRFEGRRPVAAVTDQGEYGCDALVINADFARAMTNLVPDRLRRRWSDRKIARKEFSCSTFMLYLGIEGLEESLPHHTIYISKDYSRNLREIEKERVLTKDCSFYVQNACVTDPSLAPPGNSTLYVLAPVPHQTKNINWAEQKQAFRGVVLKQLEKVGLRDIEKRIRVEHVVTPADWDQGHQVHLGATFNLAHSLKQMLHLRPRNRFEDLESTYLVGGGTHPGSGLPVIYESARISSRLLMQDFDCDPSFMDVDQADLSPLTSDTAAIAGSAC